MLDEPFPPPGYIPTPSQVEGIQVYMPAPAGEEEHREVVDFQCPRCGAATAYSISEGGLTCTHCGYYEAPPASTVGQNAEEFEFTVETMTRAAQGWGEVRRELACQNCGAQTTLPADSLTLTCPFCASNRVIQRQAPQDVLRPRFLVPFKVSAQDCQRVAGDWLVDSWMVPRDLRGHASQLTFSPVYLPYWTIDARTAAVWKAEVGHQQTERYYDGSSREWKTRTRTVWRWENGKVQLPFEDMTLPGTTRVSALLLEQISPFTLDQLTDYDPKYLAGLQALAYDIPLEAAWESARQEMREYTRQACRNQASTSQIRNFSMALDFSGERWRYILLPVFVAAYQHGGQPFRVLVNGVSGRIAGQRPVDWRKVWLVIAALLTPGLILSLAGLVTLLLGGVGLAIGGGGFVLLLIGAGISFFLFRRAQAMDDV